MVTTCSARFLTLAGTIVPLLVVCLLGTNCATPPKTPSSDPKTAIAKIAELQTRAQTIAGAFKKSHPATDATYVSVRSKYRDGAAKNKTYLATVQAGVLNREKKFDTPSYRAIAKDAADAAKDFLDLAETSTPAEARATGIASAAIAAADILAQAGIDIWKACKQMEADKAKAEADSLRQYEWPAWENL